MCTQRERYEALQKEQGSSGEIKALHELEILEQQSQHRKVQTPPRQCRRMVTWRAGKAISALEAAHASNICELRQQNQQYEAIHPPLGPMRLSASSAARCKSTVRCACSTSCRLGWPCTRSSSKAAAPPTPRPPCSHPCSHELLYQLTHPPFRSSSPVRRHSSRK